MTYRGRVKNGVVVLEGGPKPEEGTIVKVEPVELPESSAEPEKEPQGPSPLFRAANRAKPTGISDLGDQP